MFEGNEMKFLNIFVWNNSKIATEKRRKVALFYKLQTADSVSTYYVSSVQLVTDQKLEAFNKA